MNDVNDLNMTDAMNREPTQTISINAVNNGKPEAQKISINAANGLTGVDDSEPRQERQVIKINPNRSKASRRPASEANIVNPDDLIEKTPEVRGKTPRDVAVDLLAQGVERKREEFRQFIEAAEESDRINREKVEAGLETVGGEVQYMPDNLHTPIKEEDKVTVMDDDSGLDPREINIGSPEDTVVDDEPDDFDEDDAMNWNPDEDIIVPSIKVVTDPFDDAKAYDEDFHDTDANDYPVESVEDEVIEEPTVDDSYETEAEAAPIEVEYETTIKEEETPEENIDDVIKDTISKGSFEVSSSALAHDPSTEDFEMDESDFEDVTSDTEELVTDEEAQALYEAAEKNLKSEILKKIIQAGKKLDTSQFVVSSKVINVKDALKGTENKVQKTGKWPMMFANRPFIATALKGPEVALLAETDDSDSTGSVGITMDQARIMFEHDANPYRPSTMEAWAKTIPIYDVESIFAALYIASLKDANYIPMACTKQSCQHAYLADNIDINSMVKFTNDESKEQFEKIKNTDLTPENTGAYESVVNVLNDKFAVGLKIPSVFTMLFEYSSLSSEFIRKYSTMVSIIHYIDYIYAINEDTQEFQPIGWKSYPGDNAKTFKSKIATYSKILKELDDTDFSILMSLIDAMVNTASTVKYLNYEIPATKCPKCNSDIEAREIYPRGMLFTRQRLVELATTPTER